MKKAIFRNLGLAVTLGVLVLGPVSVMAQSVTGGNPVPPPDPWSTNSDAVMILSLATL